MYTKENVVLEHSPLPSHHLFLRRALVKAIYQQIESWNSSKNEKATETEGSVLNTISSEQKLNLIQLWKQCSFLNDLLNTSQETLKSKQTCTRFVQANVLSVMSLHKVSSKFKSCTDQKYSSSSNSVKLLFDNKVQTDSSLAECSDCSNSSEKRGKRGSFRWLYKYLPRMRSGRKSKSTQHSETFDKLLQTREDLKNIDGEEMTTPENMELLKSQFDMCHKCGRIDPYKPLTHNEIDTIKMLIKMEAKQNYRQINIIIRELNEHKNEIKKLNSIFEQLTQDYIKKHRSASDVNLQEEIKALYDKYQKLSQKYNEIEEKANDVLKKPTEDPSKLHKSRIPVKSNKSVHHSKQKAVTERPRVKEKDTKNLINASQKSLPPRPSSQPHSSKVSNPPSKNTSVSEKSSSELSLFKDHIVYSVTENSKMVKDSQDKIPFPESDISTIVVQKLIDVMEREKSSTTNKLCTVCVRCKKRKRSDKAISNNQSSSSKNVFSFIRRRK